MKYDFDEVIERRNTNSVKYDLTSEYFGTDELIPMWVADMDFRTPDFIMKAIRKRAEHDILGYSIRPDSFYQAIIDWYKKKPANIPFKIRAAHTIEAFPRDSTYHQFIEAVSNYYCIEPIQLIKRIRHFITKKNRPHSIIQEVTSNRAQPHTIQLTEEQQAITEFILPFITKPEYVPTLLHGVTGSGKTEVYKKIMQK